ncbi:MAG TPA: hypothetical protein VIP70_07455 [Nitrososphaeraceae archaeon]
MFSFLIYHLAGGGGGGGKTSNSSGGTIADKTMSDFGGFGGFKSKFIGTVKQVEGIRWAILASCRII